MADGKTLKTLGCVSWFEYTDTALLREMGDSSLQGNRQAEARESMCVIAAVRSPQEAVELCRVFVRDVFAIPSCCHYDGTTLSMYCGDAGSGWQGTVKRAVALCEHYMLAYEVK